MKTADIENPNHGVALPRNRAHGAVHQNRSRSIKWAVKQEKFQPKETCFFLTSTFIEQIRQCISQRHRKKARLQLQRVGILRPRFMEGALRSDSDLWTALSAPQRSL